jgi:hypothetical protein
MVAMNRSRLDDCRDELFLSMALSLERLLDLAARQARYPDPSTAGLSGRLRGNREIFEREHLAARGRDG